MLERVTMDGLELPRLYIAENAEDIRKAKDHGLPYVKWNLGVEKLVRVLLRPALERMFPDVNWNKVLGHQEIFKTEVVICSGREEGGGHPSFDNEYDYEKMLEAQHRHDESSVEDALDNPSDDTELAGIADGPRAFDDRGTKDGYDRFQKRIPFSKYAMDAVSSVDIKVLQNLGMLPKFMGDITDCIRTNISNSMHWSEGYTKKLGATLGNFNKGRQLPNLIILDVSGSIPRGISSTMCMLIDTLREQCEADLIITASRSGYYPHGAELPNPQTIMNYYGRGNESWEFYGIIDKYVAGREWGHVISFGDDDWPGNPKSFDLHLEDTKVHEVHHYHTNANRQTGYARWTMDCLDGTEQFDKSWCSIIR